MSIFLGNLPIELKVNSNQTQIIIIPRYFPYDDDFFGKIYYKANNLFLCLEIEHDRHKYIRRNMHIKNKMGNHYYYKKKLHTKFFGLYYWHISKSDLNKQFTLTSNQINNIYQRYNKSSGYKFKIRATYRYDYYPSSGTEYVHNWGYNKARTNVFSNEVELILP